MNSPQSLKDKRSIRVYAYRGKRVRLARNKRKIKRKKKIYD
jgi:hypothetical protein